MIDATPKAWGDSAGWSRAAFFSQAGSEKEEAELERFLQECEKRGVAGCIEAAVYEDDGNICWIKLRAHAKDDPFAQNMVDEAAMASLTQYVDTLGSARHGAPCRCDQCVDPASFFLLSQP